MSALGDLYKVIEVDAVEGRREALRSWIAKHTVMVEDYFKLDAASVMLTSSPTAYRKAMDDRMAEQLLHRAAFDRKGLAMEDMGKQLVEADGFKAICYVTRIRMIFIVEGG